jgi:hypothetical protein
MTHKTHPAAYNFIANVVRNSIVEMAANGMEITPEIIEAADAEMDRLKEKIDIRSKIITDFTKKVQLFREVASHPNGRNLDHLQVLRDDMRNIAACATDVVSKATMDEMVADADKMIQAMKITLSFQGRRS